MAACWIKLAPIFALLVSTAGPAWSFVDCGVAGNPSCRTMIGKKIWIAGTKVSVCPSPNSRSEDGCKGLTKGGMVVRDIFDNGNYTQYFVVALPDGSTGYIETLQGFKLSTTDPAEDARKRDEASKRASLECERRGQPKIGMTGPEVAASCWGSPVRIVKKTTAAGVEENYVYGLGHIVKLVDGKVSEIVESR